MTKGGGTDTKADASKSPSGVNMAQVGHGPLSRNLGLLPPNRHHHHHHDHGHGHDHDHGHPPAMDLVELDGKMADVANLPDHAELTQALAEANAQIQLADGADAATKKAALIEARSKCKSWLADHAQGDTALINEIEGGFKAALRDIVQAEKEAELAVKQENRRDGLQTALSGGQVALTGAHSAKNKFDPQTLEKLGEYEHLDADKKAGPEGRALLKSAAGDIQGWLDANRDADAQMRADMKAMMLRARAEVHELTAKPDPDRQSAISNARSDLRELLQANATEKGDWAANERPALNALHEYETACGGGAKKNSGPALEKLKDVQAALQEWLSNHKKDAAGYAEMKNLKASVDTEVESLQHIRDTVDRMMNRNDALWASDGIWNESGPITFKRPPDDGDHGLIDSMERQMQAFESLLENEVSRSSAAAELFAMTANSEHEQEKPWFTTKNCVGFCDNPGTGGIDMDHLQALPKDPVSAKKSGLDNTAGVCQGEILLHVLEERYHMFQTGLEGGDDFVYIRAHNLCLSEDSYQNRYRHEIGIESSSLAFDPHNKNKWFHAIDSDGSQQITKGIDTDVTSSPQDHEDYGFGEENTVYVRNTGGAVVDKEIAKKDALIRRRLSEVKAADARAEMTDAIKVTEQELYKHLLRQKFADEPDPDAAAEAEWKRKWAEWTAYFDNPRAANAQAVAESTAKATALLDAEGNDDASKYLKSLRDDRPREGLNDSLAHRVDGQSFENVNCALTSLGAISNKSSSDVVRDAIGRALDSGNITLPVTKAGGELIETREDLMDQYCGLQSQELFFRLENGMLDLSEECPKGGIVGDAQLRGLRGMLAEEATRRNAESEDTGLAYTVVQDGLNEDFRDGGTMYPAAQMFDRMARYPNGTQFEVFLRGDGIEGHWVYAEIYNGELILEDYQKARNDGTAAQKKEMPSGYVGEIPHHPVNDNPDALELGMFLALTPNFDPATSGDPDVVPAVNEDDWSPIGSKDDEVTAQLIAELTAAGTLGDVQTVLDTTREPLGPICDKYGCNGLDLVGKNGACQAAMTVREAGSIPGAKNALAELIKAVEGIKNAQVRRILHQRIVADPTTQVEQFEDDIATIAKGLPTTADSLASYLARFHGADLNAGAVATSVRRLLELIAINHTENVWSEAEYRDFQNGLQVFDEQAQHVDSSDLGPQFTYSGLDIASSIRTVLEQGLQRDNDAVKHLERYGLKDTVKTYADFIGNTADIARQYNVDKGELDAVEQAIRDFDDTVASVNPTDDTDVTGPLLDRAEEQAVELDRTIGSISGNAALQKRLKVLHANHTETPLAAKREAILKAHAKALTVKDLKTYLDNVRGNCRKNPDVVAALDEFTAPLDNLDDDDAIPDVGAQVAGLRSAIEGAGGIVKMMLRNFSEPEGL